MSLDRDQQYVAETSGNFIIIVETELQSKENLIIANL